MEGSLAEAPFSARPGQPSPFDASKNFGVDRCPVKLRIPKKQKNGASQCPDPTPHLLMRFCPKCGYEDPVIWHSYRWITDIDYCRFEDFQTEYPQWRDLQPGQIVSDEYNYYRRTSMRNGGCFVQRWPKIYGIDYYKSRFFERFKAKRSFPFPGQKTLADLELEASN